MAEIYKTKAYIIDFNDYTERDRIYTCYTEDFGKKSLLVKGVKDSKSKMISRLDSFNLVSLEFVQGRSIDRLVGIVDLDTLNDIKSQHDELFQLKLALLYFLFEFIKTILTEEQQDLALFHQISVTIGFIRIGSSSHLKLLVPFIIFHLLYLHGVGINLNSCVICKCTKSSKFFISFRNGGLIDSLCSKQYETDAQVTLPIIAILSFFQLGDFNKAYSLVKESENRNQILKQLFQLSYLYLNYESLKLKSLPFLQQVMYNTHE